MTEYAPQPDVLALLTSTLLVKYAEVSKGTELETMLKGGRRRTGRRTGKTGALVGFDGTVNRQAVRPVPSHTGSGRHLLPLPALS